MCIFTEALLGTFFGTAELELFSVDLATSQAASGNLVGFAFLDKESGLLRVSPNLVTVPPESLSHARTLLRLQGQPPASSFDVCMRPALGTRHRRRVSPCQAVSAQPRGMRKPVGVETRLLDMNEIMIVFKKLGTMNRSKSVVLPTREGTLSESHVVDHLEMFGSVVLTLVVAFNLYVFVTNRTRPRVPTSSFRGLGVLSFPGFFVGENRALSVFSPLALLGKKCECRLSEDRFGSATGSLSCSVVARRVESSSVGVSFRGQVRVCLSGGFGNNAGDSRGHLALATCRVS